MQITRFAHDNGLVTLVLVGIDADAADLVRELIMAPPSPPAPPLVGLGVLSPREREVFGHITDGSSNSETGRLLGISPRTVETHRARVMDKLGARNTADLVRIRIRAERPALRGR